MSVRVRTFKRNLKETCYVNFRRKIISTRVRNVKSDLKETEKIITDVEIMDN